jgi:N-acetylneuraminic acid mutarotase
MKSTMLDRSRAARLAACLLLCALAACTSRGADWKPAAASPIARFEGPGVVIGGKLYVFGGFHDADLHASPRVDVYDPEADQWRRLTDMPVAVTHLTPALDGNTVWFAGGFQGDHPGPSVAGVWKYDVANDSWSAGPPLPQPRGSGALVRAGRALHFFGGFAEDRDSTPGDHWALDLDAPAPAWRERAALPDARGHLSGIEHEGLIYAIGGQHGHDEEATDVTSAHVYDPRTDRWRAIAPLPTPRSHFEASTFVWNGRIVMAGGRNNQGSREAESLAAMYDPKSDRWTDLPSLPKPLLGPVLQPIGNRLILTTGSLDGWQAPQTTTYVIDAEEYFG